MLIRITISLLLLHCCLWASAQNPRPYFRNYTTDDGLPSSEVHYCLQDPQGYIWFATDNGVSRFDGYTFKNFGPREGLKHNVVFYMQRDPAGRIWLATMNGPLYYVEKDSIHAFPQNDQIEEANPNANLAADFFIDSTGARYLSIRTQGILQFTAQGEFRVLSPEKEDIPRLAVRIQDRWIVGNRPVPLSKRISPWEIRPDPNFVRPAETWADPDQIIDSVLESATRRKNEFWMKQLNSEETLVLWYQNLLLVKNHKIVWRRSAPANMAYKSISVDEHGRLLIGFQDGKGIRRYGNADQIKSDRYEQFLAGVSAAHIYRDARLEREMNELQRSALRAQMNPHFIFNCLNSNQHFITRNDQENATKYLAKFARLIRRTLNASTEKEIAIQDEIDLLENYLELEKLRFKEKFAYRIEIQDQLDTLDSVIPPLLTQPYVENAILHGLNGIDSGGQITIRFQKEDTRLIVEVEDNGVGIHQSQSRTDSDHSPHRSVGMRIPQDRLKLANAGNRVTAEEIRDERGAVQGTLVRMWIEQ